MTPRGADQIAGKPRLDRINSAKTNTSNQPESPARQGFHSSSRATTSGNVATFRFRPAKSFGSDDEFQPAYGGKGGAATLAHSLLHMA